MRMGIIHMKIYGIGPKPLNCFVLLEIKMKLALKSRGIKIHTNLKEIKKNKFSKNKAEIPGFKIRKARDMITISKRWPPGENQ